MAEENPSAEPAAAASTPRRAGSHRYRRPQHLKIIILLAVLILIVGGVLLWRYFSTYESTDDAQVDAHLYPVSARVPGYVTRVNVDDNQYVQDASVLVEIDPKDYEIAVDKARADLANAEATAQSLNITVPITSVNTSTQISASASEVESTRAGIVAAEQQVAAAHAQVEQAEANNVKAQDDLKRYKRLVENQNVSEQTYDQSLAVARASAAGVAASRDNEAAARQAVEQARQRFSQAEANSRAAQTGPQQVASTRARALSAAADVQQKRAALAQAELNLGYTRIVAPVRGQVTKNVVVGMNVQPGQQLLTLVPLEEIWITANFKETQLRHMRRGQIVDLTVDSTGRRYRGRIDSIGGATGPLFSVLPPENATGNYVKIVQRIPVKIVLDPGQNSDLQLRPGMSVEPRVHLQ